MVKPAATRPAHWRLYGDSNYSGIIRDVLAIAATEIRQNLLSFHSLSPPLPFLATPSIALASVFATGTTVTLGTQSQGQQATQSGQIQREKDKTLKAIQEDLPYFAEKMLESQNRFSIRNPDFTRKNAGRGHHVINNGILSYLRNVLKKVLDHLLRLKGIKYDLTDLERLAEMIEHDFSRDAENVIRNIMVANITVTNGNPPDFNSVLFGIFDWLLTEIMRRDMLDLIMDSNEHRLGVPVPPDSNKRVVPSKMELHVIIELMIKNHAFVDIFARDIWIGNSAARQNVFDNTKATVEKHLRSGLKHFDKIIGILRQVYKYGGPISRWIP
ncbi:uncharacterized protein LOC134456232 [Engraulis encrasicolus]|uniref:uncharacterized protein LOC134456232 n=1 Tax=Engraulis encrasicolus TaxID=184585 RepID=UPI002FD05781